MKSVNLSNLHEALAEVDGWVQMAEETFPSETVAALYQARAWEMLACNSWESLCDSRGWSNFGLAIGARREVVSTLRQEGMSTRAIAAATGVSNATVSRDLEATVTDVTVQTVTSLDGRTRPATQPVRVNVTVSM